MPKERIGKISMYYEVAGNGDPVLLIAGLGSDSSSWLSVSGELARNFKVITFDNRGCGRSDSPKKRYSVMDMADDAVALLDHLGIDRCHIVGHSMGGYIAQEIAINYPRRVNRVVLEASAAISSRRNNILFRSMLNSFAKNNDMGSLARQWAFWLFSPRTFEKEGFIADFIRNVSGYPYPQSIQGSKRQIEALAGFNSLFRVRNIKAKTLVLAGGSDILIRPQESKLLAERIKNSRFKTIEGAGHCIHIEDPAAFIRTVRIFLRGEGPV